MYVRLSVAAGNFSMVQAAGINETTSCAVAIKAFENEDRDGIIEAGTTIKNVMQSLDDIHTNNGEAGVLAPLSDKGMSSIIALALVDCQSNPRKKLRDAASKAYMELRAFQQSFR